MMCEKPLSRLSLHSFWHRALLALLLTLLPMALSSQNSEPKSNNSSAILQTWRQISERFQSELTALQQDLQAALDDAKQSKTSLQKLTVLYENSLTRITNLEAYNEQIGQRMQESDEWNAELQDKNMKLKADVKIAKANGLRNAIIAGASGIALGFLIPFIIKLLGKLKIIPV
jgi:Skp family chaperone for outer membrane proteins